VIDGRQDSALDDMRISFRIVRKRGIGRSNRGGSGKGLEHRFRWRDWYRCTAANKTDGEYQENDRICREGVPRTHRNLPSVEVPDGDNKRVLATIQDARGAETIP
jgi:hypothetical protein